MKRKILIAAATLGLAALAFIGGAQWNARHDDSASSFSAAATGRDAVLDAPRRAESVIAQSPPDVAVAGDMPLAVPAATASWPPLPSPDRPLAEIFGELEDRAQRGDPGAACRLASELQRCAAVLARQRMAEEMQRNAARMAETPDALVEGIARMESANERLGVSCDGIGDAQLQDAYRWQRAAALADPSLRLSFALSPALSRRDFVNELERWADYRRLALQWLEEGGRQGDPAALIALARLYGDHRLSGPPLPPFRIRDEVRFLAYADLMQRYGMVVPPVAAAAEESRARLSADELERAAELTDSLFRPDLPAVDAQAANSAMRSTLRRPEEGMQCGGAK